MPETLRAMTPEDMPNTGNVVRIVSRQEEHEEEVVDHVVALLNVAMILSPKGGGPEVIRLVECHMCGTYTMDHDHTCPVPQLEDWLASRR